MSEELTPESEPAIEEVLEVGDGVEVLGAEPVVAEPIVKPRRKLPFTTARLKHARDRFAGAPLRVRLVALTVVLAFVGLFVAGTTAVTSLRGYLYNRVDEQLQAAGGGVARGFRPGGAGTGGPPSQYYVQYSNAAGTPVEVNNNPIDAEDTATPKLPKVAANKVTTTQKPFTVGTASGHGKWRVLVGPVTLQAADGTLSQGTYALAIKLDDVQHTVSHLVELELIIGLIVLVAMAGGSYYMVRTSLKPLAEVERTAELIAAGDMSLRVKEQDPRTEVGKLGSAFNTMLGRIESAFHVQQASEESARTSEARMRRFVADASHELRTPLTSIRGFAELHRQGAIPEGEPVERAMARIEGEATRMGVLVDDLLLLARLDQQRPLEQAPVDMSEIASDVVGAAKATTGRRKVTLQIGANAAQAVVLGDKNRLHQVVSNLVSNAITHTPASAAVEVRVAVETRGGRQAVVLEVQDHGPGLAPEDAARVFERFYRADTSRTRANGGSGLGLSIVSALIDAHGGGVELDTAPGEGATFRVILPLHA